MSNDAQKGFDMIRAVIFDMFETLITHYHSPLYFSEQMAADAGIPAEAFRAIWRPSEHDRTVGKKTLEEALEKILRANERYSKELLCELVRKRVAIKKDCFRQLHPEILPMLSALRERGVLIGLISNCFSEEVDVIRESTLYPYVDAGCFSYEEGVAKPDPEIFRRCMDKLAVNASECLYVGDGGSEELEAADDLGMTALQAVWYLKERTAEVPRHGHFRQLQSPLDILNDIEQKE